MTIAVWFISLRNSGYIPTLYYLIFSLHLTHYPSLPALFFLLFTLPVPVLRVFALRCLYPFSGYTNTQSRIPDPLPFVFSFLFFYASLLTPLSSPLSAPYVLRLPLRFTYSLGLISPSGSRSLSDPTTIAPSAARACCRSSARSPAYHGISSVPFAAR